VAASNSEANWAGRNENVDLNFCTRNDNSIQSALHAACAEWQKR
jgi:hypothetical protein